MKFMTTAATALALAVTAQVATASDACDEGEVVIKFSHVTNTDKHPKGIAASLLEKRVNEEMDGKACMEVFPNSTLYNDNQVLEAMLQGDVQLAAPSLSKFEAFTKQFRIFDLPFMFKDINHGGQRADDLGAVYDTCQQAADIAFGTVFRLEVFVRCVRDLFGTCDTQWTECHVTKNIIGNAQYLGRFGTVDRIEVGIIFETKLTGT